MSFNLPTIQNIPGNVFVACSVFSLRSIFDYALESKSIFQTLKRIHIDLLWMGLVVWGVFLFDLKTNNMLSGLVGNNAYLRFAIFCFLLCVIVGATKLKKVEVGISLQKRTLFNHTKIISITLALHGLAFINLAISLIFGQAMNSP